MAAEFTNTREFIAELGKAEDEVPELSLRFQKRLALEALQRVVNRTPVDTGRARGGWQVARTAGDNDPGTEDPAGASTVAAGLSIIDRISIAFQEIHIFNNVNYIVFLEEGSSQQAPNGMVATTIRELEQIARQANISLEFRTR